MSLLKRLAAPALCALFIGAMAAQPALADDTRVYTNNTSDAFAWVTVYKGSWHSSVQGAWCVPPGKYDKHGVDSRLYEVFVEVSQGGCQRHILINKDMNVKGLATSELRVGGTGGMYTISGAYRL
jgi:hypothetical protein